MGSVHLGPLESGFFFFVGALIPMRECEHKKIQTKKNKKLESTVCHSPALVDLHHSIYLFSSIPTERRNVEFKLDVTHCYKGWKISRPYACTFGFAHVLNQSSLDIGILLYLSRRRGHKRGSIEME